MLKVGRYIVIVIEKVYRFGIEALISGMILLYIWWGLVVLGQSWVPALPSPEAAALYVGTMAFILRALWGAIRR